MTSEDILIHVCRWNEHKVVITYLAHQVEAAIVHMYSEESAVGVPKELSRVSEQSMRDTARAAMEDEE